MKRITSLSTLAALCATTAMAEGVEYLSYGGSYNDISNGAVSIEVLDIDAGIDYRVGSFVLSGDIDVLNVDNGLVQDRITTLQAGVAYDITPQALVYADIAYFDIDSIGSQTNYQIGGEYSTNGLTFGLLYSDTNDSTVPETIAAYTGYQAGSVEVIGLFADSDGFQTDAIGLEFDDGTYDVSALFRDDDGQSVFGVGAKYDFGNGFRVLGNYTDIEFDGRWIALGGGYEVSEDTWVDLSVGQLDFDGGGEADTISLAINFEMGAEGRLIDRALTNQQNALGLYGAVAGY